MKEKVFNLFVTDNELCSLSIIAGTRKTIKQYNLIPLSKCLNKNCYAKQMNQHYFVEKQLILVLRRKAGF